MIVLLCNFNTQCIISNEINENMLIIIKHVK